MSPARRMLDRYINSGGEWIYFNVQRGGVRLISSPCLEMNYRGTRAANNVLRVICLQIRAQSVRMGSQKETEKNGGFTMLIETSFFFLMCGEK